jgi:methylmalonyl-CoA/ethylmalonyl-CoA epimerase
MDAGIVFEALGPQFHQLGIVVPDVEAAAAAHRALGPWSVYTYDRSIVDNLCVAGEPADFTFRLAFNQRRPQLEFIEPVNDSPYAEWLQEHGPGLHHLGFFVEDFERATTLMRGAGLEPFMSGSGFGADGSGAYAYYDTVAEVGYFVEAIDVPTARRPPESVLFPE